MILSIAWRNVWRNKLRSLVIMLAVMLGLIGGIFSVALMNGMMEQMISNTIQTELANIQIHHPKYLINNEIRYNLENTTEIIKETAGMQDVKALSPRIKAQAMASTAASGTGVMISGIDPEREKQVTNIHEMLTEGTYFNSDMRSKPIVVGKKLAKKLGAKVNSKIVITVQDTENVITYGAFRIAGIFETHNSMFDESNVFVKTEDLAELIGADPSHATGILVKLNSNKKTDEIAAMLSKDFPEMKVQTWSELRPEFEFFNSWMQQMLYFFLVIILLGLAFGIVNAMLMAVMERVKEIGMLMAVGMNKRRVFSMIMLETVFLSITGGVIGIIAAYGLVEYYAGKGIDLSVVADGLSEVGYASMAYPSISNSYYFIVTLMVIVTALISSVYPARKALKLKPAEAIRDDA